MTKVEQKILGKRKLILTYSEDKEDVGKDKKQENNTFVFSKCY